MLKVVKKLIDKEREYGLNLDCDIERLYNCQKIDGSIQANFGVEKLGLIIPTERLPVKVYSAENGDYFLDGGNRLFKINENSLCQIAKLSRAPLSLYFEDGYLGGGVVISTGDGLSIFNDTLYQLPFPSVKYLSKIYNYLLGAVENHLIFFDLSVKDEKVVKRLALTKTAGMVVGVVVRGGTVYVVCQRAVFALHAKLSPYDNSLSVVRDYALSVQENTVVSYGAGFVFVSSDEILGYNGQNFINYGCVPKGAKISDSQSAFTLNGSYVLPLSLEGKTVYYFCDLSTKETFIFYKENCLLTKGGLVINFVDGNVGKLQQTPTESVRIESKFLDLACLGDKTLKAITLYANGSAKVKLLGDFGEREFSLSLSKPKRFCLRSQSLKLQVDAESDFVLNGVKITYQRGN